MSASDLMATSQRLNMSVEALAALGAELRAQTEGIDVPPAVRELLGDVVSALGDDLLSGASTDELRVVVDGIRTNFIQAAELLSDPGRAPGWVYDDPVVLQSQGGGSVAVARLICSFVPSLEGLGDRLDQGGRFLDVGTGVGRIAIELATQFPALGVVGIDPWRPALELAEDNVVASGMADRIELREQRVENLPDVDTFDLVWLAGPFLPPDVTEPAIARSLGALHPGGWLVIGAYAGPDDPLAATLGALRTVRSGGRVLDADESIGLLTAAGFVDVARIERTWPAPVDFVVGRTPSPPF